jgi:hypothetical protein
MNLNIIASFLTCNQSESEPIETVKPIEIHALGSISQRLRVGSSHSFRSDSPLSNIDIDRRYGERSYSIDFDYVKYRPLLSTLAVAVRSTRI